MRVQAIILSLVILISLLITRNAQDVKSRLEITQSSFLEELSLRLTVKTKTAGEGISQAVGSVSALSKGPVHHSVIWKWDKINQNFLNLKQWVMNKTGIFLAQSNANNTEENQSEVSVAEEIINFPPKECN